MPLALGHQALSTLDDFDLEGKRVFLRVDFNAPVTDGVVSDDTRIKSSLDSIAFCQEKGARVVLASHFGRPKGKTVDSMRMLPVAQRLQELTGKDVAAPEDCFGDGVRKVLLEQKTDQLVLLENLRFYSGEKENEDKFARLIKNDCDIYINDAFGAMHRAHASIVALPSLFAYAGVGRLVERELKALQGLANEPAKPFVMVLGGAKVSDKIKLIETLLSRVDKIIVGGAMAFTFLKSLGCKVGRSLCEDNMLKTAEKILSAARNRGVEIVLPKDFLMGSSPQASTAVTSKDRDISHDMMGLDIGPQSIELFSAELRGAQSIFWNGPMGLFENDVFAVGTHAIAQAVASQDAYHVVGGGDSLAALSKTGQRHRIAHVSTGGGATLSYLQGEALPGLKALAV